MNSFTVEQLTQTRREVGRKWLGRQAAECSHSSSWERSTCRCWEVRHDVGWEGDEQAGTGVCVSALPNKNLKSIVYM